MFDTIGGAALAAKRVKRILGITRSQAQEIVARAAGCQNWHQLTTLVDTGYAPTNEGKVTEIAAYLSSIGLARIDPNEAMSAARPDRSIYALRPYGMDLDFYPFNDIRPFLRRDVERMRMAIDTSSILKAEHPNRETDDDIERDRAAHFMELRKYELKGSTPEDMTSTGHIMATSEYYASTYWSLIPSENSKPSISLGIEGSPENTRDPVLAVRNWGKIASEAMVDMPSTIEDIYQTFCERIADKLKPMLPKGKAYSIRIDALRKIRVEVATSGIGMTLDEYDEGFDVDRNFAHAELADMPRAFFIESHFTNEHLVFPIEGLTYEADMGLDSTVYVIDGQEMVFTNSRSYSLQPHSEQITVIGEGLIEPGPGAPLKKRVNPWANTPFHFDEITITSI